jgi:hypothetical protein
MLLKKIVQGSRQNFAMMSKKMDIWAILRPSNEHSHQAWFKFAKQFWERKSK